MTWIRIDDGFRDHPKFLELSHAGTGLWAAGLGYCNKHLTDGRIPAAKIPRLGERVLPKGCGVKEKPELLDAVVKELVDAKLWLSNEDGSYLIHDYLSWNDSRQKILAKREADRVRKESARNPHGRPGGQGVGQHADNGAPSGGNPNGRPGGQGVGQHADNGAPSGGNPNGVRADSNGSPRAVHAPRARAGAGASHTSPTIPHRTGTPDGGSEPEPEPDPEVAVRMRELAAKVGVTPQPRGKVPPAVPPRPDTEVPA